MEGWTRPEHLASTAWLADAVDRAGVRIVDARWRPDGSGRTLHALGHIPGAVYVDWRADLIEAEDDDQLLLASADRIAGLAAGLGIGDGTDVIVYDDSQSLFAARVWWSLRAYGLASVRVLDGGFGAWVEDGRTLATGTSTTLSATFHPTDPDGRRVVTSDVRSLLGSPSVTLLDARAPAEFKGFEGNTKRLGHIPGAVNVPVGATSMPGSQKLRDAAALRDLLHSANVSRGRRMICYDGSGVAAAKLALVLTLLGHDDVAVYDGGWAEWGNRLDLPVDR
jgi:thiosulfate/3-mercaptopyruvate sulfurtransferase